MTIKRHKGKGCKTTHNWIKFEQGGLVDPRPVPVNRTGKPKVHPDFVNSVNTVGDPMDSDYLPEPKKKKSK